MKVRMHFFIPVVSVLALVLSSTAVLAQAVPSSAEGSRVEGQITPMQAPKVDVVPRRTSAVKPTRAPKGASKVKINLKSVTVKGMSAYDTSAIASLYKKKIGKTVTLAWVYQLADTLTAKYRNEGYILTRVIVPPQTIASGKVKLRVVEGFVDKVTVQGETRQHTERLQGFAKRIRATKPLNAKALERYLLLMNDLPGVSARAVLAPSATTPGASDVTLVVEQKNADVFLQADNRGSRFLGSLQLNAGIRLNNTFGLYEGLNFQFVTAPEISSRGRRELDFGSFTWAQPLGFEGVMLNMGGSVTSTHPGFTLDPFTTRGLAHALNVQLSHPFVRSRSENLTGRVKFDYLNTRRNNNLGGAETVDKLRVLRFGGVYQFTDGYLGANTLDVEVSQGLRFFGASEAGDANLTRALGDPRFTKAVFTYTRVQRLTNKYEGFFSVKGQKSANTLLASEEFGVGGISFGSAYDNSEITGENGLAGRIELRANNTLDTGADFTQLYSFYDLGKVWDRDNAVVKSRRRSLASTGAGARVTVNETLSGTIEAAMPLTRQVATQGNNDIRVFGSMTARF